MAAVRESPYQPSGRYTSAGSPCAPRWYECDLAGDHRATARTNFDRLVQQLHGMEYAHVRCVACSAGAKLHEARDGLSDHDVRAGGKNVVDLSAQDRLAALRHPCEVRAGAATAHRRLVEVE